VLNVPNAPAKPVSGSILNRAGADPKTPETTMVELEDNSGHRLFTPVQVAISRWKTKELEEFEVQIRPSSDFPLDFEQHSIKSVLRPSNSDLELVKEIKEGLSELKGFLQSGQLI